MTEFTLTARYTADGEQVTIHPDEYHSRTEQYTTFLWKRDEGGVEHVRSVPTDHVIDIQKEILHE